MFTRARGAAAARPDRVPDVLKIRHQFHQQSELEWMGKEILMQERLASGETNITQGTAQLIVSNRLTAKHWFVGDLSHAEKPFIVQTEEPVTATMLDKPDDPDRFHRNKLIFGAQTAVGAGYAWPHFIQGSNGQGS
jgi:hypothetical protein